MSIEDLGLTTPRTCILGIDPGLTGALALYDFKNNRIEDIQDVPTHEIKGGRVPDLYNLALLMDTWAPKVAFAVIEDVGVMSGKEGKVSMFNFGKITGILQGMVASFLLPTHFVKPAIWKKLMGLSYDKDASRARASQYFPRETHRWARKKDDGRAEALLLAYFGTRFLKMNGKGTKQ